MTPPSTVRLPRSCFRTGFRFGVIALAGLMLATFTRGTDLTIVELKQGDVAPQPLKPIDPEYPSALASDIVDGLAVADYVIGTDGTVLEARCLAASDPLFAEATLTAIRRARFKPARVQGKPVAVRRRWTQEFVAVRRNYRPLRFSVPAGTKPKPPLPVSGMFRFYESNLFPRYWSHLTTIYPYEALLAGQAGEAKIQFYVRPDNDVGPMTVLSATSPEFAQAAMARLRGITFQGTGKMEKQNRGPFIADFDFRPSGAGDTELTDTALSMLRVLRTNPDQIITTGLDAPLTPLRKFLPSFPVDQPTEGTAEIEVLIDKHGRAQLPRIISCNTPEFGASAAQAAAMWLFVPPLRDGKSVIVRARIPFNIKVGEPAKPKS